MNLDIHISAPLSKPEECRHLVSLAWSIMLFESHIAHRGEYYRKAAALAA